MLSAIKLNVVMLNVMAPRQEAKIFTSILKKKKKLPDTAQVGVNFEQGKKLKELLDFSG